MHGTMSLKYNTIYCLCHFCIALQRQIHQLLMHFDFLFYFTVPQTFIRQPFVALSLPLSLDQKSQDKDVTVAQQYFV